MICYSGSMTLCVLRFATGADKSPPYFFSQDEPPGGRVLAMPSQCKYKNRQRYGGGQNRVKQHPSPLYKSPYFSHVQIVVCGSSVFSAFSCDSASEILRKNIDSTAHGVSECTWCGEGQESHLHTKFQPSHLWVLLSEVACGVVFSSWLTRGILLHERVSFAVESKRWATQHDECTHDLL